MNMLCYSFHTSVYTLHTYMHIRGVPIIGSADKSATDKLIFTTSVIGKTYPELV